MYPLEIILTKDSSPKNFRDELVEVIRHYIGLTGKIYVHSGTSTWMFHIMDHMYISDSQLRKDPVCADLSAADNKPEEHPSLLIYARKQPLLAGFSDMIDNHRDINHGHASRVVLTDGSKKI